jgi:hypothetical protein
MPIRSFADVVDAMGTRTWEQGLVVDEGDLAPEFFDLRTGLAGELFQKFVNYGLRVAIVLPNPETHGERFKELAYEHRSHSVVRFVTSRADADAWLQDAPRQSLTR